MKTTRRLKLALIAVAFGVPLLVLVTMAVAGVRLQNGQISVRTETYVQDIPFGDSTEVGFVGLGGGVVVIEGAIWLWDEEEERYYRINEYGVVETLEFHEDGSVFKHIGGVRVWPYGYTMGGDHPDRGRKTWTQP